MKRILSFCISIALIISVISLSVTEVFASVTDIQSTSEDFTLSWRDYDDGERFALSRSASNRCLPTSKDLFHSYADTQKWRSAAPDRG